MNDTNLINVIRKKEQFLSMKEFCFPYIGKIEPSDIYKLWVLYRDKIKIVQLSEEYDNLKYWIDTVNETEMSKANVKELIVSPRSYNKKQR
jgi:hypothetical protein